MKFDELEYPDCSTCPATKLNAYSARCDANGEVQRVVCFECDRGERLAEFDTNKVLTSRLAMDAALKGDESCPSFLDKDLERRARWIEINAASKRIHTEIKAFERVVWFGGLQAQDAACEWKGMKHDADGLLVMSYSMCGRTMITMERGDVSVTVITATDESEPRMGMQGIRATEADAVKLLRDVCSLWTAGGIRMMPDGKVSVLG